MLSMSRLTPSRNGRTTKDIRAYREDRPARLRRASHKHRSGIWSETLHHRASCERRTSSLQPRKLSKELARPAPRARIKEIGGVRGTTTLRQTCRRQKPSAQYAFKISMILEDLQFTLRIAFRCVLHRCESQDIRC